MPDIKTNALMPRGETNGLTAIASQLADEAGRRAPRKLRAALILFDARRLTVDADTGDELVTIRVRRAELVLPEDQPEAEKLIRRSSENRLGATVLPLDLEREIETTFKGLNLDEPDPDEDAQVDAELREMTGDQGSAADGSDDDVVDAEIADDDEDQADDPDEPDDGWDLGYPEGGGK